MAFTTEVDQLTENILQITVEKDGRVVGRCHLFTAVHWDEWWVAESERGKSAVLRLLVQASLVVLQQAGLDMVYTGVEDDRDDIAALLVKFGFLPAPGRLFLLKVDEAAMQLKTDD